MEAFSLRDYINDLPLFFEKADKGETVFFNHGNHTYALMSVEYPKSISLELKSKIEQARLSYKEGKCVSCATREELENLLDSL